MKRATAWVALLLMAAGCRTPLAAVRPLAPDDPRPPALLRGLARRAEAVRSVRGTARVSIEGARGAGFAKQLVLLERPAKLRVEVIGLLNQRIAVLATDGRRYELYRAEDRRVEAGDVHPAVLLEVAGLPLTPEEAVALLLGAPGSAAPEATGAAALPEGGVRVQLAGPPPGLRRSLDFDAAGNLRRYAGRHADDPDTLLWEVSYDDFRSLGGTPFAHHVAFDFPASGARAEVSFRDVELNPALPGTLFRLQLPAPEAGAGSQLAPGSLRKQRLAPSATG